MAEVQMGSMDFVDDCCDEMERRGWAYAILVGVPGKRTDRIWSNMADWSGTGMDAPERFRGLVTAYAEKVGME